MKKEWFADWFDSPYYHVLYQNRDHQEAEAFIKKLITFLNPKKGATILDVACGKGRHAKQMAELGFQVTGIDLSKNSIDHANVSKHENLAFFVHDMRLPFQKNQYDFVFNFFTSFGYFDTAEENQDAMNMMAEALKEDGTLVMDYLNAGRFIGGLSQKESKVIDGIIFETEKMTVNNKITKTIKITDEKKGVDAHFSEAVSLLTIDDFQKLALQAGLKITAFFGDYELNPYDENNSERLIMIFSKARSSLE